MYIFIYKVYDPFNATNTLKYLIDQLKEKILLIDQSKNTSRYL